MTDPQPIQHGPLDALLRCLESDAESSDSSENDDHETEVPTDENQMFRCKTAAEDMAVPLEEKSINSSGIGLGMCLHKLFTDSLQEAQDFGAERFDWEDDNDDQANTVQGDSDDAQDDDQMNEDGGHLVQSPVHLTQSQPTPKRRRGILSNYFSSPTAKQLKKKSSPCMFCNSKETVLSLREHLDRSSNCKYCYFSLLHVSCIDGVLAKTFTCMFCARGGNYLKSHLTSSNVCLEAYYAKFNVTTIKAVLEQIQKLKRDFKKEHIARNKETNSLKTEVNAINNHSRFTAFVNYRVCVFCKSFYPEACSAIVDEMDPKYEFLKNEEVLRRFGKFYTCEKCSKEAFNAPSIPEEVKTLLFCVESNNKERLIFPKIITEDEKKDDEHETFEIENESVTKIMFPSSVSVETKVLRLSISSHLISVLLNKCDFPKRSDLAILYLNQLNKYRNIALRAKHFTGNISHGDQRIITNVKPIADDRQIRGSQSWTRNQNRNIEKRFDFLGQNALKIEVKVPLENEEVEANNLLIEGFAVTVSFEGDETKEEDRKFWVHPSHLAHELCTENCEKVLMSTFIENRNIHFQSQKYISTYLNCVSSRLNSLVENIVKCPASILFSENFFFTVTFDGAGVAYIEGLMWPKMILIYNEDKSEKSFFGGHEGEIRQQFFAFIESSLSSMTNKDDIKDQFNLNNNEAEKLEKLVKMNQVHHKENCLDPPLPSLMTTFKELPEVGSMMNIYEARELCKVMVELLVEMPAEEREELSTEDWLKEIGTWKVEFDECFSDESISFKVCGREFTFILETRLSKMITKYNDVFLGVYHYAISCGENSDRLILKRPQILDVFTYVYNPFILTALKSPLEICLVNSFSDSNKERLKRSNMFLSESGLNSNVISSHSQISLQEAFSLADPRCLRDVSSPPIVFVNTNMDTQQTFLKVKEATETSFKAEGSNEHFELQYNIVSRHKTRINGLPLLLVETACLYEYIGSVESQELFAVYQNQLDKIPLTETTYTASPQEKMPTLILTSNGSVLKHRSSCKVLNYPDYEKGSIKQKYSRILLFFPLEPNAEVSEDQLDNLFYQRSENAPLDSNRQRLTIIDNYERIFLRRVIHSV